MPICCLQTNRPHTDTETAEQVIESLVALAQGRTLIVATHDPALAARMARVIQLSAVADAPERIQGGWHGA